MPLMTLMRAGAGAAGRDREAAPDGGATAWARWLARAARLGRGSAAGVGRDDRPVPAERAAVVREEAGAPPGVRWFEVEAPHQQGPNRVEVLVPDGVEAGRRWPVVYLLPVNTGVGGPWGSAIEEAIRDDLANRHGAIFVAPSYDTIPWYGDHPTRPEVRQSAYLTDVVVPLVDRTFPTVADAAGRAVVGFSKSGLGALSLFIRRPDLFGAVAAFDPAIAPNARDFAAWGVAESHGTRENFDRFDPFPLLGRLRWRRRGPARRVVLLSGGPGPRIGAERYRRRLDELKVPFVAIHAPDMAHTWTSGWLPLAVAALRIGPGPRRTGRRHIGCTSE